MADEKAQDDNKKSQEEYSRDVLEHLKMVDSWHSFDIFYFTKATNKRPIKFLTRYLLYRYGFVQKFAIDPTILENFTKRIEHGYNKYNNAYHNPTHASDVTQSLNSVLRQNKIYTWWSDLEIFAGLFAAVLHDYEHSGTTNGFNIMTKSNRALIYNDRSVQENHHLSASFLVLQDKDFNILSGLSCEEYRRFRSLVIDLILSTDMAFHFQILKDIKLRVQSNKMPVEKSKALSFIVHAVDISNPAKNWNIHSKWTAMLMEEFFKQGDLEKLLNIPVSPLCDRHTTQIPESQINFIDFIIDPAFNILGDLMVYITKEIKYVDEEGENKIWPWVESIKDNKYKWQEQKRLDRLKNTDTDNRQSVL